MKYYSSLLGQTGYMVACGTVLAVFIMFINLTAPVSFDEDWKEIEIPKGSPYSKGIDILKDNGIIKNTFGLRALGKITFSEGQLKPGYYYLSTSMTPLRIFDMLINGRTIHFTVTIPEGTTLRGIKRKLEEAGLVDEISWQLVYDKDFLASLDIDAPSLEGYIYPDTYNFPKGIDPAIVFKVMVQRLRDVVDESMTARAAELGMTEKDMITLASIIEKEAIHDSERPIISAVYHNRLKKNMKLQADPTVLYGVKKRWKRIRYRDLKRKTPYNTYRIKGLPLGPIASPGFKSIKAALYPADVDYLFFVSMNNGRHHFSLTGKEHLKAVQHFQINGYNKAIDGKEKID